MGWGQRPGWPREAHTNLWSLQCQPKSPSAGQLVGYSFPVPPLGSTGVRHVAFFCARLREPAFTVARLQGDTHSILQAGRLPEGAGEDLGSWGKVTHWMSCDNAFDSKDDVLYILLLIFCQIVLQWWLLILNMGSFNHMGAKSSASGCSECLASGSFY